MSNAVNADPNTWYHINCTAFDGQNLAAAYRTGGANASGVFTQTTNNERAEQKWQFFPYGDGTIIRAQSTGSNAYFYGFFDPEGQDWFGQTSIEMRNISIIDPNTDWNTSTLLWDVEPWNNEEFNLRNRANGSDWYFNIKGNAFAVMDKNTTGSRDGQRFSLVEAGPINDERWSTVALPIAAATGSSIISAPTSAPTSSDPPASTDTSSGLSTGAKAGIGVGIGVAVLAALILGVFLFLRQRRKKRYAPAGTDEVYVHNESKPPLYEAPHGVGVAEAPSEYYRPAELPGQVKPTAVNEAPVELPAGRR